MRWFWIPCYLMPIFIWRRPGKKPYLCLRLGRREKPKRTTKAAKPKWREKLLVGGTTRVLDQEMIEKGSYDDEVVYYLLIFRCYYLTLYASWYVACQSCICCSMSIMPSHRYITSQSGICTYLSTFHSFKCKCMMCCIHSSLLWSKRLKIQFRM